jgi:hypothetical protein
MSSLPLPASTRTRPARARCPCGRLRMTGRKSACRGQITRSRHIRSNVPEAFSRAYSELPTMHSVLRELNTRALIASMNAGSCRCSRRRTSCERSVGLALQNATGLYALDSALPRHPVLCDCLDLGMKASPHVQTTRADCRAAWREHRTSLTGPRLRSGLATAPYVAGDFNTVISCHPWSHSGRRPAFFNCPTR